MLGTWLAVTYAAPRQLAPMVCENTTVQPPAVFIWPAQGMPARVDAIVVLGGPGDRLGKGLELARQGRAPVLVVSRGLPDDQILGRIRGQHGRPSG